MKKNKLAGQIIRRIKSLDVKITIIGMGYVGLPLARAFLERGMWVVGFDIDSSKVKKLLKGTSYIKHIPSNIIKKMVKTGRFQPTDSYNEVEKCDCIILCVPTPLTPAREPDLSYIENTMKSLLEVVRKGQIIILESTTYPGTTKQMIAEPLERKGFRVGKDIFVAYSPEREDPGNPKFRTTNIPKVVGADDPQSKKVARMLYSSIVPEVIEVSSTKTAEAVKLTENIFRAVNIALVNELKVIFMKMGIDIWEVISAAKTKPFGYMPFYPGPGLGGHCIPIDPFYLSWKARHHSISTRFIELAGEINTQMPSFVVSRIIYALNKMGKCLKNSKILIIGMAYKKDVDDIRESPSLELMHLLKENGAKVKYYDPYLRALPPLRKYPKFEGIRSISSIKKSIKNFDAVVIATNHSNIDYRYIANNSCLVIDCRGVCPNSSNVVRA